MRPLLLVVTVLLGGCATSANQQTEFPDVDIVVNGDLDAIPRQALVCPMGPRPRPIRHKWLLPTPPSGFGVQRHEDDADLYVELVSDLTQSR